MSAEHFVEFAAAAAAFLVDVEAASSVAAAVTFDCYLPLDRRWKIVAAEAVVHYLALGVVAASSYSDFGLGYYLTAMQQPPAAEG